MHQAADHHAPAPGTYAHRPYPSAEAAAADMAREGAAFLRERIAAAGRASVVLTGGSSPGPLYRHWAEDHRDAVDWRAVHFFWGDERNVPPGSPESNTTTSALLLDHVPVDTAKLHRWRTELPPADALDDMEAALRSARCAAPEGRFDLVLLGVGGDGHVASLFPHDAPWRDLAEAPGEGVRDGGHTGGTPAPVRFVDDSPKPPAERYTFTLPVLRAARRVWLMPFGEAKAEVRRRVLARDRDLPASWLGGGGGEAVVWG